MPGTARIAIPGTMGAPGDEGLGAMQIPPVMRIKAISFIDQNNNQLLFTFFNQ